MYPPAHHIETDLEKIYQVIDTFNLATLISNNGDDVQITHLPLMLDRSRGDKGVLIGHIDKANPQVARLDNQTITALFNGPNTYISPTVYQSPQVPTWNYINVHIKGRVTTMHEEHQLQDSLVDMTEFLEPQNSAYKLDVNDRRIQSLKNYIIGFEIDIQEIVGRFKLSQDKSAVDTELAKQHLVQQNTLSYANLIDSLLETK